MAQIPSVKVWADAEVLTHTDLNNVVSTIRTTVNNTALFTDMARTVTSVLTFSVAPVFSAAQTFADAVTVTTGGLTITAGGLTVTDGGVTVTGNSTITGTLGGLTDVTASGTITAATFAGSAASLTALPAAEITGTLPAISGANLTSLNASNISSGTLASARLPATIDTNVTAVRATTVGGASGQVTLNISDTATSLITVGASGAQSFSTDAPVGATDRWLRVLYDGTEYRIAMRQVT
jgi:hypothetical protein